jgi:hypothetical protein
MAGIKITDLSALSVAESGDYLCIVDVSDTSQSPAGTTKKIEVANCGISGTWTPTLSDFTDAISAGVIDLARYSRTGSVVTCTITGSVAVDFSVETSGSFDFTLPIASASYDTIGCANIWKPNQCNGIIKFGGRLLLSSADTSFAEGAVPFYAIFQYEID